MALLSWLDLESTTLLSEELQNGHFIGF